MNLFQRYEEILRRLVTELKALYGARLVACAVYGSVGRGTPRQDSDVDLLIVARDLPRGRDRKSTRLNSSHLVISYAVFCLKKKKTLLLYSSWRSRRIQ